MIVKALDISAYLGTKGMLISRQNGIKARDYVVAELKRNSPGAAIEVDFTGINICDVSFLDEFIPPLLLRLKQLVGHILFVSNLDEGTHFSLECVLAYRELRMNGRSTILCKSGDTYSLCGSRLEPNLTAAAQVVFRYDKVTARMLADELGIPIHNASTRMKRLFDLRLVGRYEERDVTGRHHYYILPKG
jgi:hypothetical protein